MGQPAVFEHPFQVSPEDIDRLGHVNNCSRCLSPASVPSPPARVYQLTCEQADQSFGRGRVGEDRVASAVYGMPAEHRRLHDGHHFARFGAEGGKAEDAIVGPDQRLGEPARLREGVRSQHECHRLLSETIGYPFAWASASLIPTWASSGSVNRQ